MISARRQFLFSRDRTTSDWTQCHVTVILRRWTEKRRPKKSVCGEKASVRIRLAKLSIFGYNAIYFSTLERRENKENLHYFGTTARSEFAKTYKHCGRSLWSRLWYLTMIKQHLNRTNIIYILFQSFWQRLRPIVCYVSIRMKTLH